MICRFSTTLIFFLASALPPDSVLRAQQNIPAPVWQEAGVPYLQNFSPKEYQDTPQNWCIAQDDNGLMYFGNYGVLVYDGVSWDRIDVNETAVRSLAVGHGRIYVGAQSELGYLAPGEAGRLRYFSLRDSIPEPYRDFQDVWRTLVIGEAVYFQTFNYLFRYAGGKMKVWQPQDRYHLAFAVHDTLFMRVPGLGLMKLVSDSLRRVAGGERFADISILTMLPFDDTRILIGTLTQGLFLYEGAGITPFATAADVFLRERQLYHGAVLPGGLFALGTLRGGVVIIDRHGNRCQILNKASGLRDDRIHALYADPAGALWLALNNGLARAETPGPFSRYATNAGIESTVEYLTRHRGKMYAATHNGVYALHGNLANAAGSPSSINASAHFATASSLFKPVAGIASHSWFLLNAGEHLLAATDEGVYQIQNERATLTKTSWPGAICLYRSQRDTTLVFAGLFEGLAALRLLDGAWRDLGRFQNLNEMVVSIAEAADGTLWLGTQYEGVLRIAPDSVGALVPAGEGQTRVTRFGQAHGLPNTRVSVASIAGKILFATQKGLRRFDSSRQRFTPDSTLGAAFADTSRWIFRLHEDGNGNVWIITGSERTASHGQAQRQPDGSYLWRDVPWSRVNDLGDMFVIYPERDGTTWFGGAAGIARYSPLIPKDYARAYPAMIRRVSAISVDSVFYHGASQAVLSHPVLEHRLNSLRFEFAALSFEVSAANQYQYLLSGFDRGWSNWNLETKKDYTGLREGDYVFRVRAKNIYGQESREAHLAFSITPPWYRRWWAYAGYLALFAAGVFVVDRKQRARVIRKEQEKAKLREAEITKQKNFELRGKNEQLEKVLRELNAAQNHLSRSESRFRSVAQSANDAIITTDNRGQIMFWNKRAQVIFGYAEEEALGKPLTMLMPERYREAHEQGVRRFFQTGEQRILGRVVEMHALRRDGSEFPIELSVAAWQTDEGQFVTGIIRDITKRKQAEEALENTQALLAAENWRKSEEMEKARQLQLAMLPRDLPQLPHLEIEAYMKTATEVGGDYYDLQIGEDGELTVVIGDATGHGLNAGMMVTATKSILTTLSHEKDLVHLFTKLNDALSRVNLHRHYMALQMVKIKDCRLEICSAGMPPLLLYRAATKTVEEISLKAMPLGNRHEFPYRKHDTRLACGDVILLMSDGLPELFNMQDEIFDHERVKAAFAAAAPLSPAQIIAHLVQAGETWAGDKQQQDDMTFLALKVKHASMPEV